MIRLPVPCQFILRNDPMEDAHLYTLSYKGLVRQAGRQPSPSLYAFRAPCDNEDWPGIWKPFGLVKYGLNGDDTKC